MILNRPLATYDHANLATALKDEIRRLAKKEIKAATGSTKQAVAQYRRDIASLKRIVGVQQKEIAFLKGQERKRLNRPQITHEPVERVRFPARSVRAQRRRLGLSAEHFATLVGVSALTIYNWEHEKARPNKDRIAAFAALRKVGRREALKKLEMLEGRKR